MLGLLPAIAAANSGLIQVTSARAWSHPGSTRVVIETTGAFEFRSDRASNPERLFFDILGARPWIDGKRFATKNIGDALVKRLRIAETAPGTTRIVFDLEGMAEFTATKLDTPDRLVVEIRPRANVPPVLPVSPPKTMSQIKLFPPPELLSSNFHLPMFFLFDPLPRTIARPVTAAPVMLRTETTRVLPSTRTPSSDVGAKASANAAKSMTRTLGLKVNRVVIDAGHGGHDQGTVGPNGVLEKDVVLDVALRVAKLVQEKLGAEVVLTRSDDTFIPLQERTAIANNHHADLFLSIHANSSPASSVAGTETFFLNFTNSPGALDVAARENAGSDKSVGELKDLIRSITLNDKIEESRAFAQEVEKSISVNASKHNPAAKDRGIKRAPFVVLIGASMPSVLAEIGFLSNSRDEKNLGKADYRQKVAESLFKGIAQYSESLSHFDFTAKPDRGEKKIAALQ